MSSDRISLDRRSFLSATAAASAAAAIVFRPGETPAEEPSNRKLAAGSIVLFQGDSITDAGRDRKSDGANNANGLGNGYPFVLACDLLRDYSDPQLKVYNRGISGNKVPDLKARWQADCLDLKPDVLSILIGVNDIWHKLNGNYQGTTTDYETQYRELLEQTTSKLPKTRLVICEPFVLKCGAVNDKWFPEFDERRAVAKKVACEFEAVFVPFQAMFDEAVEKAPPEYWAADGVHPSLAGDALMAKTWREATGI